MAELLQPDWRQAKPTFSDVQDMCQRLPLKPATLPLEPFDRFLAEMRARHRSGGAHLAEFDVGPDLVFDWYASRNRLTDERLLDSLLTHPTVKRVLADLLIPSSTSPANGLGLSEQFILEGKIAGMRYGGGAYWQPQGDGRSEKLSATEVCDAMFGLRFGEISCYLSYEAWTPWFKGIAWDFTAIVFDRRMRKLWILTVTDTD